MKYGFSIISFFNEQCFPGAEKRYEHNWSTVATKCLQIITCDLGPALAQHINKEPDCVVITRICNDSTLKNSTNEEPGKATDIPPTKTSSVAERIGSALLSPSQYEAYKKQMMTSSAATPLVENLWFLGRVDIPGASINNPWQQTYNNPTSIKATTSLINAREAVQEILRSLFHYVNQMMPKERSPEEPSMSREPLSPYCGLIMLSWNIWENVVRAHLLTSADYMESLKFASAADLKVDEFMTEICSNSFP